MTLLFTFDHSNKENELQKHRPVENPYVTRKKVLTATFRNTNAPALPKAAPPSTKAAPSSDASSSIATVARAQINEESPTIKRILAASGCASVEELLVRDQQRKSNTQQDASNGSKSTTKLSKASAMNGAKAAATNRAKTATNRAKSTNGVKATNGSKNTNPKKKAKSKYALGGDLPIPIP